MALSRYRYVHYDVFTDLRFGGNQLAVFPEAGGLAGSMMQQIANEIGFAETTFVLPPERFDTDARMRIFTPAEEMPMAGHPTIGSTFALAREGRIEAPRDRWVFGLNIGPTPVNLEWNDHALAFAWMIQKNPVFDQAVEDVATVAAAIGVQEAEIRNTGLPVQQVSCGVPYIIIPLESRHAVDRAIPGVGPLGRAVYLFTSDKGSGGDRADTYSRMFAPAIGVFEDAATGSAGGPLGSYLVKHRVLGGEALSSFINLQGVKMGRPSWIHIQIRSANDAITDVRVGGTSVFVAEGTMEVEA